MPFAVLALHVISDAVIALAYYSIPVVLVYFARKRRDLPFIVVFWLFGLFIVACGTTHVLAIWTIWHPDYWLDGAVKALTAAASIGTAIVLLPLIPKALALRSPAELDRLNGELQETLRDREVLLERERATARTLQDTLARYRMLSEVTRDVVLFTDRETGDLIDANQLATETYGYSHAELTRLNISNIRAPETVPDIDQKMAAADRPNGVAFQTTHQRRDGTLFPADVFARPVTIGDRRIVVSTIRDISEQRRADEALSKAVDDALEASRLKSQFVATMSHEIRTPMNGVIGVSELLLETPLNERQRECAQIIKESGESLLRIINDILDFSKLEAGKVALETVDFEPSHLVESVAALLRPTAESKGLKIFTVVAPDVPDRLRGDPVRVRQVLWNLAGNAVKFTEDGMASIGVRIQSDDDETVVVRFEVADTGMGMSEDVCRRLFEAFMQGDSSTTRRFGGTGLGLSISRRLVELMGGEIGVASHVGEGSTFWFTARFERASQLAVVLPDAGVLTGRRVLLVEDDPGTQKVLARFMGEWGIKVTVASDPVAAVEALQAAREAAAPFDLAVIDHVLPCGDGISLALRIRADATLGGALPLVMITGFDAAGRRERALECGFQAYITKPVVQWTLCEALCEALAAPVRTALARTTELETSVKPGTRKPRILLAEDKAVNRRVAEMQIERLGYELESVTNGREAVEAVRKQRYDVVLMDCHMPEVDGFAATRAIRLAEQLTGDHVCIVALTANALEADRRACMDAGMDDYLSKPLQLEALHGMFKKWLSFEDLGCPR